MHQHAKRGPISYEHILLAVNQHHAAKFDNIVGFCSPSPQMFRHGQKLRQLWDETKIYVGPRRYLIFIRKRIRRFPITTRAAEGKPRASA